MSSDGHHPRCEDQWFTFYNDPVGPDDCPTCRAHRAIDNAPEGYIFDRRDVPLLAAMHAGRGWTKESTAHRWTPEKMQAYINDVHLEGENADD